MRGEVILLSRNIQIRGQETNRNNWGCTILTTKYSGEDIELEG
jgi:hypothetical protein